MLSYCGQVWNKVWRPRTAPPSSSSPEEAFAPRRVAILNTLLGPFEWCFVSVQSILVWHRPQASLAVLGLVHVLFWVLYNSELRPVGVLFVSLAAAHVYYCWVYVVWPEIRVHRPEDDSEGWTPVHPDVLSVPQISQYLNSMCDWFHTWFHRMIALRRNQPGLFCFSTTTFFVLLAVLGNYVSGFALCYAAVMFILLGPGLVLHVYPWVRTKLSEKIPAVLQRVRNVTPIVAATIPTSSHQSDSDIDEFLPESTVANLSTLSAAAKFCEQSPSNLESTCDVSGLLNSGSTMDDVSQLIPSCESMDLSVAESSDELHPHPVVVAAARELGLEDLLSLGNQPESLTEGLGEIPSHEDDNSSDEDSTPEPPTQTRHTPRRSPSDDISADLAAAMEDSDDEPEFRLTQTDGSQIATILAVARVAAPILSSIAQGSHSDEEDTLNVSSLCTEYVASEDDRSVRTLQPASISSDTDLNDYEIISDDDLS